MDGKVIAMVSCTTELDFNRTVELSFARYSKLFKNIVPAELFFFFQTTQVVHIVRNVRSNTRANFHLCCCVGNVKAQHRINGCKLISLCEPTQFERSKTR